MVDVIEEDAWDSGELCGSEPFRELKQFVSEERQKEVDIVIEPLRQQGLDVGAKLFFGKPFLEIIREVLGENHDVDVKKKTVVRNHSTTILTSCNKQCEKLSQQ